MGKVVFNKEEKNKVKQPLIKLMAIEGKGEEAEVGK